MIKEIKLPEIAANVTTAVVLEIMVSVGDKIAQDETLAEMESDKATFELPSEASGIVKEIKISTGDEVKVGQVMFTVDTSATGSEGGEEKEEEKDTEKDTEKEEDQDKEGRNEDQEKDKVDREEEKEKEEKEDEKKAAGKDQDKQKDLKQEATVDKKQEEASPAPDDEEERQDTGKSAADIPASPSVRRLARELGVDISKVKASGPENRVTTDDIKAFTKKTMESRRSSTGVSDTYEMPDFSQWGTVRREKLDTIRRITAREMAASWQSIPHVFQFDKADITELETFRSKYSKQVEKAGAKLTFTAILLKITAEALKTFPAFNGSIDMKNEEMIYKDYINIGVAVDTERGLLVPVIRDADKKSITELSIELNELADKARKKKIMPDALQGGNFAISNLGGIGGTNFTPIVYRPNVAILGVSRSQIEPVYTDGEFKPRMMLPLSLSYDHRAIDGASAARFLRWLCEALENPLLTMFK